MSCLLHGGQGCDGFGVSVAQEDQGQFLGGGEGSSLEDHGLVFRHGKTRVGMLLVGTVKALFEKIKSEETLDNELEISIDVVIVYKILVPTSWEMEDK